MLNSFPKVLESPREIMYDKYIMEWYALNSRLRSGRKSNRSWII